ncbi:DUF309 domain-containing protein [bacterium]|nr:DUF309 domain-containing protein [bacterium]NUN45547.1 DUF309 domain-containing protein [bacterium]
MNPLTLKQHALWLRAVEEFNRKQFYICHETLETLWRDTNEETLKRLLQGVLHIAVALYHLDRNNAVGYELQMKKGLVKLNAGLRVPSDLPIRNDLIVFYREVADFNRMRKSHIPMLRFNASAA